MRILFASAGMAALLAGCAQMQAPAGSGMTASDQPPANIVEALEPFYAGLEYELPQAPMGAPLPGDNQALSSILFGSCHRGELDLSILNQIVSDTPDMFLYVGDNVYGDNWSWDPTLPELREAYAVLGAAEEFGNLRTEVPMMATWDDHDYGMNDFGAQFPFKGYAEDIFLDFWRVPADDERRARPGVHTSRVFGPEGQRVQIILLDTRYFRGALRRTDQRGAPGRERYLPTEDTSVTMLGDEQWAWFEEQLAVPADLRLVVSSIQVHADGHGWEAWRTMPHERERFYETIARSEANGVVIVSGDRHSSGLYVRDDVIGYPLYEITSSSLNMSYSDENNEPGPHRIGEMYAPVNYGAIEVDWELGNISLQIRDDAGTTVRDLDINIGDLQVR